MSQTLAEKAAAIASVLFLLEDHYRYIAAGRTTARAQWLSSGVQEGYHPPPVIPPDVHDPDYPDEAWMVRQRQVTRAYRLWPVGLALQALWKEHPGWAQAVESLYVNLPPTAKPTRGLWLDAGCCTEMAAMGLEAMAKRVWGDVPVYMPQKVSKKLSNQEEAYRLREECGCSYRQIAKALDVDKDTVGRWLKGRCKQTVSSEGGQVSPFVF